MPEGDEGEEKVENEAPEEPPQETAQTAEPPTEEPAPEPEPTPPPEPQPEPTEPPQVQVAETLEPVPEETPAVEAPRGSVEQRRRSSSVKRASIEAGSRSPRDTLGGGSPPRRSSAKRSSLTLRKSESISGIKKKFTGLGSKAKMVLGSILDIKSNAAEIYDKKSAKYQNTYKMESDHPFNPEKVDKVLRSVMEEVLENLQYDAEKCVSAAKFASSQIRSRVKQLEFDRYKIVCIVSIGEKNSQDVYATCRFLWDPEKDRYSFYSLENTHVYAIAYCFGLYYE